MELPKRRSTYLIEALCKSPSKRKVEIYSTQGSGKRRRNEKLLNHWLLPITTVNEVV